MAQSLAIRPRGEPRTWTVIDGLVLGGQLPQGRTRTWPCLRSPAKSPWECDSCGSSVELGDLDTICAAVANAFAETGAATLTWPDPNPDRRPAEDEYSRCRTSADGRSARGDGYVALGTDWSGPMCPVTPGAGGSVQRARGAGKHAAGGDVGGGVPQGGQRDALRVRSGGDAGDP